jgi:hypothetical protein
MMWSCTTQQQGTAASHQLSSTVLALFCVVSSALQASFSKQLDVMPLLLAAGARPGVTADACDDVELHYAATNSNWTAELVQQIVDAGCPLNPYNGTKGSGCTPLVLASSRGNTKVGCYGLLTL